MRVRMRPEGPGPKRPMLGLIPSHEKDCAVMATIPFELQSGIELVLLPWCSLKPTRT